MAGLVFPVEQRVHSWLMVNISRPLNATHFPFHPPPETGHYPWLEEAWNSQGGPLPMAVEGVSIGLTALYVLQAYLAWNQQKPILSSLKSTIEQWRDDAVVKNLVKVVVGVAMMVVLVPLLLPVLTGFWLISLAARLTYIVMYESNLTKAAAMDSVWGLETEQSRPFITICLLLRGVPCLDKICAHLHDRILDVKDSSGQFRFRKFRQVFLERCGYYCWRDAPNFSIRDHVKLVDLRDLHTQRGVHLEAQCGGRGLGSGARDEAEDELVKRVVSERSGDALEGVRPPWEVVLLVRSDGRYNVVIRLHHAIGDGVSLVRLCVETLLDHPVAPPSVGPPPPGPLLRAAQLVWSLAVLPLGLVQLVCNTDSSSLHGPPLLGRKVMSWSRGVPLAVVRQVKAAAGTTVNDVLMSCLAAALAKHFSRRRESVEQVTALMPLSFHDLRQPLSLTNHFSVATLGLPTRAALAPLARLSATKRLLDGVKRDPTLQAVYWTVRGVSGVVPAPVASLLLSGRGVTLGASNVPGPQESVSVWGDVAEELVFLVPNRAPVGVGVSFSSYCGVIKAALNVDEALVASRSEAQLLLEEMEQEVYRLHHSLNLPPPGFTH